jgi:hypothetical protein
LRVKRERGTLSCVGIARFTILPRRIGMVGSIVATAHRMFRCPADQRE